MESPQAENITFGSVCSGIEAASVAWEPLGWKAAWLSEIEPFPSAVLAHHYPDVPNLGDMTALPGRILSREIESPDVFCGGTPCQAFSVAGKRQSLDDARGNLSLTFCEIANAIDTVRQSAGREPCIVFWENVPGVLSTKDNAFGCFLGELSGEDCALVPPGDKWSNAGCVFGPKRAIAWRVLDAQYFGVAQRRRRVFVVASARDGFNPAAILFEFDGLRRDSAPSREKGQSTTHDVAPSLTASGRGVERIGDTMGQDPVIAMAFGGNNQSGPIDVATARNACGSASGRLDFESETFLVYPVAFSCKDYGADAGPVSPTLRAMGNSKSHANAGGQVAIAFDARQDCVSSEKVFGSLGSSSPQAQAVAVSLRGRDGGATAEIGDEVGNCLRASSGGGDKPYVLAPVALAVHENQRAELTLNDTAGAIKCAGGKPGQGYPAALVAAIALQTDATPKASEELAFTLKLPSASGGGQPAACMTPHMDVRRLTPTECERLQGFPGGYTAIPWRKKPAADCPDGPRYKGLGNSWAVPVVRWIGQRIANHLRERP